MRVSTCSFIIIAFFSTFLGNFGVTAVTTPSNSWDFRGCSSSTVSDSVGGIDVTIQSYGINSICSSDGLYMNGDSTSYASTSSYTWSGASGMSWEVFANVEALGFWFRFFDFGQGGDNDYDSVNLCGRDTTDDIFFNVYPSQPDETYLIAESFITTGEWLHIVVTISTGGVYNIYKNGELSATRTGGAIPANVARTSNYIGKSNFGSGDATFQGTFGYLNMWVGTELSATDASDLYAAVAPTSQPTMQPIPLPTSAPVPLPTSAPVPLPTSAPVPLPTSIPVPLPTSVPVPLPTSVPVPLPTSVPIPSPTVTFTPTTGTSAPSQTPVFNPTALPVFDPTPSPSLVPNPSPTQVPAPVPTTGTVPAPFPTQMPVSTPTDCLSDCSSTVLATFGDQDAFCALDDISCTDDCGSEWITAHCECDTGALFASYSYDFAGNSDYCCGDEACQDAVLDMYVSLFEVESTLATSFLETSCQAVQLSCSYSYSYGDDDGSNDYYSYNNEVTCGGGVNAYAGNFDTVESCWTQCSNLATIFGATLYAVDFWDGYCFCQDACDCLVVGSAETEMLVSNSVTIPDNYCSYSFSFSYGVVSGDDDDASSDYYTYEESGLWCGGGRHAYAGGVDSIDSCWTECDDSYGDEMVAVAYYDGYCWCQDACDCLQSTGNNAQMLVRNGVSIPDDTCEVSYSFSLDDDGIYSYSHTDEYYDFGSTWCGGGIDAYAGDFDTVETCWDECSDLADLNGATLYAVDFWEGGCFCQDACDCLIPGPSYVEVLVSKSITVPEDYCSFSFSFSFSHENTITEAPSYEPTSQPTFQPTSLPTSQPTSLPTLKPSPAPTAAPSLPPSPAPTVPPTSEDTTTLAVAMTLSATAAPTQDDKDNLETTVVNQIGLDASTVRNFDVTYTARRFRRQVLSGTWDVSFDVVVSIASSGVSSSTDLQSAIETDLTDSSFATAVTSAVTSVSSVNTVSSVIQTRNPSSVPIPAPSSPPTLPPSMKPSSAPTPVPSPSPKNKKKDEALAASLTFLLIAIGSGVVLLAGCTFAYIRYQRSKEMNYWMGEMDEFGKKSGKGGDVELDTIKLNQGSGVSSSPMNPMKLPVTVVANNKGTSLDGDEGTSLDFAQDTNKSTSL